MAQKSIESDMLFGLLTPESVKDLHLFKLNPNESQLK